MKNHVEVKAALSKAQSAIRAALEEFSAGTGLGVEVQVDWLKVHYIEDELDRAFLQKCRLVVDKGELIAE